MNNSQKILIVDDRPENLFSLEQTLKDLGPDVEVIRAESGNDALVATLNHDFALALLDVQMPVMDGYELAELLRSEEKTRSLPLIFISAVYSSDSHLFRGYDSGAVDFLVKPIIPTVLLSKVRVFLQLASQKQRLEEAMLQLEKSNKRLQEQARSQATRLEEANEQNRREVERRTFLERRLSAAECEWLRVFGALGHLTMIVSPEHEILSVNEAVSIKTGLPAEELMGLKCYSVFHDGGDPILSCPLSELKKREDLSVCESEVVYGGAAYRVCCVPIFSEGKHVKKIIHIMTEINSNS